MMSTRRTLACTLLAGVAVLAATSVAAADPGASDPTGATATRLRGTAGFIRVDQLGYAPNETKIAYLLAVSPVGGAPFRVVDGGGHTVLIGHAGRTRGPWNGTYRAVHPLDVTGLHAPGTYRIRMKGAVRASSPAFRIAPREELFGPRVNDAVAFFQAQRDGANVIRGPLHRMPSHLNDRAARLYDWPTYENPDSDVIVGSSLNSIDGRVNLAGGWFDAGDFIKFTHTTAYADSLLFATIRALGSQAPGSLLREARFGLRWLRRAWHPATGVLDLQVGIGSGNQQGTFNGDHDVWRLPENDDALKGSANRYLRNRPAFRANTPGTLLPPNLAGRVAATFALAAQVDASRHPKRARHELKVATAIFSAAKKRSVINADIVTALPHAFYPESSWRDDLELAAAEMARAGQALGDPGTSRWVRASARWASRYIGNEAGDDTFNLYDTSALAHADLIMAMRSAGHLHGVALGVSRLLDDLQAQLGIGVSRAAGDPFRSGVIYNGFDAAPHTFGLIVTAELYRRLSGSGTYEEFATQQRDWILGGNAWGASMMIGVGTTFPRCPQHVVANLSGTVDGTKPYLRGAVVNGPNSAGLFEGGLGGFFDNAPKCPADRADQFSQFTARGSRFVDDVRAWQTVEPALDFTGAAALAFALLRQ
jgi:hypothetical protein